MAETADHILWANFLSGDKDAFGQLYLTYHPLLLHYGIRLSGKRDQAEEQLQVLFMELYEKRQQLPKVKKVRAYLFVAYRRKVLNSLLPSFTSQPDPDANITFAEDDIASSPEPKLPRKALHDLLNALPKRQREIIYLRYFNGLDNQEIAEVLDLSPQSVRNMLFRAFQRLRKSAEEKKISFFFSWFLSL
ncbi:MAG: sigma-70 family RNA polymerase sigma factor [Bacteroidota bacterium]